MIAAHVIGGGSADWMDLAFITALWLVLAGTLIVVNRRKRKKSRK